MRESQETREESPEETAPSSEVGSASFTGWASTGLAMGAVGALFPGLAGTPIGSALSNALSGVIDSVLGGVGDILGGIF